MRKRCCRGGGSWLAWAAVAVGAFILLVLVLPVWVWWLAAGLALLGGGLALLRR